MYILESIQFPTKYSCIGNHCVMPWSMFDFNAGKFYWPKIWWMLARLRLTFSLAGSGMVKLWGSVIFCCCFVWHCDLQERGPNAEQRLPNRSMDIYGCLRYTFIHFYQHVLAFTNLKKNISTCVKTYSLYISVIGYYYYYTN